WEGKLDRVDDDLGRLVIGDPQAQDAFDLWILIGRPGGQRQINGVASFHRFHREGEVGFSHDILLPFTGTVVLLRAVAAGQEERVRISTRPAPSPLTGEAPSEGSGASRRIISSATPRDA